MPKTCFGLSIVAVGAVSLSLPSGTVSAQRGENPFADSFEHHPDVELELFAREPDIVDPVAVTFAANGDLFAVEMRDYPKGIGPDGKPGGTIRLLRDTDRDGDADVSKLFAENLSYPTSALPWRNGLLVLAPPEILYLEDTDGDDRADVRKGILTGLALGVTDGNANSLTWGPDGRVHVANGSNGGDPVWVGSESDVAGGEQGPISISGADFSFHPDKGLIRRTYQTAGGFGLVFDSWGASLTTNNTNYLQQRLVDLRYVEGRPELPAWDWTESVSEHGPAPRLYPIVKAVTRVNHPEQAGHFSSAGGMGWLEGEPFSSRLHNSVFVCDVVSNVVHRNLLPKRDSHYWGKRAPEEQDREFIASRDPWFRPIGLEQGPDGALYLVDMQREVIEHPDYIPAKVLDKLDVRAGSDRGRIYRIVPKGGVKRDQPQEPLSADNLVNLLAALESENVWRRRTAHRLLAQRGADSETLGAVRTAGLESPSPHARAASLSLLAEADALERAEILRGLTDEHAGVRATALRLGEPLFPEWDAGCETALKALNDSDPYVRFQAALSLSHINHPAKLGALSAAALAAGSDRWLGRAAILSVGTEAHELLSRCLTDEGARSHFEGNSSFVNELADVAAAGLTKDAADGFCRWLENQASHDWPANLAVAVFEGLHAGWNRRPERCPPAGRLQNPLEAWATNGPESLHPHLLDLVKVSKARVPEALGAVLRGALDRATGGELAQRLGAIEILARFPEQESIDRLYTCVDEREVEVIQRAALLALKRLGPRDLGIQLVERWEKLSPSLRPEMIRIWLGRREYHEAIISGLETGRLLFRELNLDLEQRRTLRRWSSKEIQARARKLFGDEEYTNRKDLVETWLVALPESGSPDKGKLVFEQRCALCHRSGEVGTELGPNLTGVSHRSVEDLLSHILDPNMVIDPNYVACMLETRSGDVLVGLLKRNAAESVTVVLANAEERSLPRSGIVRFATLKTSLMPEGLEAGLSYADMRDLIAFLQSSVSAR